MPEKQTSISQLARQSGFSETAVAHLWEAMRQGRGTMAQFNHPELGGMGQWQGGGMLMIGDMFNHQLKVDVAALCQALQPLVREDMEREANELKTTHPQTARRGGLEEYGQANVSGGQNDIHYTYYSEAQRLVVEMGSVRKIYDTGNHQIISFSQQNGELRFRSQLGTFNLSDLKQVEK